MIEVITLIVDSAILALLCVWLKLDQFPRRTKESRLTGGHDEVVVHGKPSSEPRWRPAPGVVLHTVCRGVRTGGREVLMRRSYGKTR